MYTVLTSYLSTSILFPENENEERSESPSYGSNYDSDHVEHGLSNVEDNNLEKAQGICLYIYLYIQILIMVSPFITDEEPIETVTDPVREKDAEKEEDDAEKVDETASQTPSAPKRKRGRPKKSTSSL